LVPDLSVDLDASLPNPRYLAANGLTGLVLAGGVVPEGGQGDLRTRQQIRPRPRAAPNTVVRGVHPSTG
jgi:hypothetical protein